MKPLGKSVRTAVKHGNLFPAVVTDAMGKRASARLSANGAIVRNRPVIGGPVVVGQSVHVDYTTSEPTIIAYSDQTNLETDLITGLDEAAQLQPLGAMPPQASGGGGGGDGHITILPFSFSDSTGEWTMGGGASYYLQQCWVHPALSEGAESGSLSFKVYLSAGTYTLLAFGVENVYNAIVDYDVDGAEVASFDWYDSVVMYNQRKLQEGIVIASSGIKTLRLRVDGKNASSAGYGVQPIYLALWRTA